MDDLFCEYQPLRARFKDQAKAYAVPAPERQLQTSQTEELRRLKAELKCVTKERGILMTLPLFRVALNPRFTRPFYAVPRTSAARTASG